MISYQNAFATGKSWHPESPDEHPDWFKLDERTRHSFLKGWASKNDEVYEEQKNENMSLDESIVEYLDDVQCKATRIILNKMHDEIKAIKEALGIG